MVASMSDPVMFVSLLVLLDSLMNKLTFDSISTIQSLANDNRNVVQFLGNFTMAHTIRICTLKNINRLYFPPFSCDLHCYNWHAVKISVCLRTCI